MRLLSLFVAVLFGWAAPAQANPAVVQVSALTTAVSTTCTIAFTITAGNNIYTLVLQSGSDSTADYAVSDDVDGSYGAFLGTQAINSINRVTQANYKAAATGTARTITFTQTNSGAGWFCLAVELSSAGGTTLAFDQFDKSEETATSASHVGGSTGITSAFNVIALSGGATSVSGAPCTPGSGYSEHIDTGVGYFESQVFASGTTAEQGAWGSCTVARQGSFILVTLKEVGGGAPTGPPRGSLMLMDAGK